MRGILLALLVSFAVAGSASGQLNGENIKGDVGLKSGSQPPPGTYFTNLSYFYGADEIKLPGGRSVGSADGGLNVYANLSVISRVTKKKFLGANYGVQFAVPLLNTQLELLRLNRGSGGGGASDLYVMPLWLGWNRKRAEYVASYAFFAPTGRFTPGGDNSGLGMWSHEIAGGTTVYLNKKKSWHVSALASYEIHQKKQGTDVRVGDLLTIEGGVGKTALKGGLNIGAAYYAQWKVTADSGSDLSPLLQRFGVENAKNRAFGLGPEINLVVPKLEGQFNVRALKEFGNRTATQGYGVVASFTFFVDRPFRAPKKQP
jgi:hypothetical protein